MRRWSDSDALTGNRLSGREAPNDKPRTQLRRSDITCAAAPLAMAMRVVERQTLACRAVSDGMVQRSARVVSDQGFQPDMVLRAAAGAGPHLPKQHHDHQVGNPAEHVEYSCPVGNDG